MGSRDTSEKFLEKLVEKGAEAAIRFALGYRDGLDAIREHRILVKVVEEIASQIASFDGVSYRCEICGKAPFTRKGLYLHIRRVHMSYVKELVLEKLHEYALRESGGVRRGGARS